MPFHVLISSDTEVSVMTMLVFLTLQIPISSLTPAPPIRGPNDNVMETHRSVVLPVALGAADNFQAFLVNFFIVDPMLNYWLPRRRWSPPLRCLVGLRQSMHVQLSVERLCVFTAMSAAVAWSILRRASSPLAKRDGDGDHGLDLMR
jgi:hypothetical protein